MTEPAEEIPVCRVLVVCLGNICRSPMARAVLEQRLEEAGLGERVAVESAGTGNHFAGYPADPGARTAAADRDYDLTDHRARAVSLSDFRRFDWLLATDESNRNDLWALAPDALGRTKIRLLTDYAAHYCGGIPDPYQGGAAAFERALDLIEEAADGVVEALRRELGTR